MDRLREIATRILTAQPATFETLVGELRAALADFPAFLTLAEPALSTTGEGRIAAVRAFARSLVDDAPLSPDSLRPPSKAPDAPDPEIVAEFVDEARRYLAEAEVALLTLETNPDDKSAIDCVFRAFHTIKGVAGFLAFDDIGRFAHAAENLLAKMRSGGIRCVGRNANMALKSVDVLRAFIDEVQEAGKAQRPRQPMPDATTLVSELERPEVSEVVFPASTPVSGGRSIRPDLPASILPMASMSAPAISVSVLPSAPPLPDSMVPRDARVRTDESAWMRVRTDRLDKLIDMVGELVIAQSMVSEDRVLIQPSHEDFRKKVAHAAKIVRELQGLSMSLRMVPLKPTFQKLARLVRDVSQRTGKDVRFVTEGDDTEIDRNMVDTIADPLVHMLRNAVDHGIEDAASRVPAGKAPYGTVKLAAFHSGGDLVLELSDDGKGMDRTLIAKKAIERGIIQSDANMSDDEVLALVFEPGFSTRDAATDISGRGVGMDVVKRGVEALKGRVETRSRVGAGTTFTVRVPLTLAVTDGMLVRVGRERFILPTIAIRTSFRPTADAISKVGGRGEFVRVRNENVPLFRLHHLFDVPDAEHDVSRALVVVMDAADGRVGFVVDELLAQQQVVSKALTTVAAVPGVAGGAILGDGQVGLILDPPGLVALARQTSGFRTAA